MEEWCSGRLDYPLDLQHSSVPSTASLGCQAASADQPFRGSPRTRRRKVPSGFVCFCDLFNYIGIFACLVIFCILQNFNCSFSININCIAVGNKQFLLAIQQEFWEVTGWFCHAGDLNRGPCRRWVCVLLMGYNTTPLYILFFFFWGDSRRCASESWDYRNVPPLWVFKELKLVGGGVYFNWLYRPGWQLRSIRSKAGAVTTWLLTTFKCKGSFSFKNKQKQMWWNCGEMET